MAFLDLTGLSYFLIRLHNTFASKDTFDRSNDGLVPHPTTSTSTRFLREDGSWEIPASTDTKVTQTHSTGNSNRPILLKNGTGTDSVTNTSLFDADVTINPSTGALTATSVKGSINPTNVLSTSDVDKMLSGNYTSTGTTLADDKTIAYLVEQIKYLKDHAILDSSN